MKENKLSFEELLTKNKLGIEDFKELDKASRFYTGIREKELSKTPIKGNFDYTHLKTIHKHIFQDVFSWAGKDRFELNLLGPMFKGDSMFCNGQFIPNEANRMFSNLKKQNYFKNCKNIDELAKNLAEFMGDLNALHPFREGNGRTQRIFINQLAQNAGYKLDLRLIDKDKMIDASIKAMDCDYKKLQTLIKVNLKSFKQNLEKEQSQGISY
ncbi:Fic/DOC family protein [Campylobacter canadensis]|uniref:protein adenylyltransferase n=3 Tax=Campylobacter canadensis TaxID=449520 RepID=A0ABS7WT62_9BACT|nr:Fic family protein [Campylobacter canadensis]MBZ7987959.1 Fic family protein [Campylobacter canadensis]MBZ7998921.1 Fic family protein [Campylobacter canadensis]